MGIYRFSDGKQSEPGFMRDNQRGGELLAAGEIGDSDFVAKFFLRENSLRKKPTSRKEYGQQKIET